jgi:hypothetical protein
MEINDKYKKQNENEPTYNNKSRQRKSTSNAYKTNNFVQDNQFTKINNKLTHTTKNDKTDTKIINNTI